MKIVFIAIKGTGMIGGIETYTVQMGRRLAQQGHEVIIYSMKHVDQSGPYLMDGMQVIPLPVPKNRTLAKLALTFLASWHQFKHKNVDILHYHAIGPSLFSFIPFLAGRTVVIQSHGYEWDRSSYGRLAQAYVKMAEKLTFKFARNITSVSKTLKKYYEKKYAQEVRYIGNGINPPEKRAASLIKRFGVDGNDYILFLGRISKEKGIHYLIEAYNNLDTNLKLVIVGEARQGDEYAQQITQQAADNPNIIFAGSASGELWSEWYSNSRIFVLPSETEGLPISLLEAMSFRNCCLVSDIDQNKEALADSGLTFQNKNPESLRKQLKILIDNPQLTEEFSERALRRVNEHYTWEKITTDLLNFYEDILKKSESKVKKAGFLTSFKER